MLQYLWLGLAIRFLQSECYSPECVEGDSANFALWGFSEVRIALVHYTEGALAPHPSPPDPT
jgi:hypothetical protein